MKEVHYARDPDNLIILVMKSGKVIACTYSREQGVIGWWRITTDGSVRSAAVTEGTAGSILWLAVQRRAGVFLERMYLSPARHVRLDAQLSKVPDATGLITGLSQLEGEFVDVLLDGGLVAESVEVVGGQVQLASTGVAALVGVPFTCTARTLPKDVRTGKARSARIGLLLNDSALPLVNGHRPPERSTGTPWDTPTALATGKAEVGNTGWSDEGSIEIVQDLPFRTEVLALYEVTAMNAA